jgi:hypothetical protein
MLGIRRGTISVVLVVMFAVLAGCCILLPTVNAQVFDLTLDSRMDHAPFLHSQGTITLDVTTYTLPHTGIFATKTYSITYNPDLGFIFRYWYVESGSSLFCYFSDPNSQSTTLTTPQDGVCSIGAVYDYSPSSKAAVGGVVMPANKLVVFAPYFALFGIVAAVAVIVAASWKKPET